MKDNTVNHIWKNKSAKASLCFTSAFPRLTIRTCFIFTYSIVDSINTKLQVHNSILYLYWARNSIFQRGHIIFCASQAESHTINNESVPTTSGSITEILLHTDFTHPCCCFSGNHKILSMGKNRGDNGLFLGAHADQ